MLPRVACPSWLLAWCIGAHRAARGAGSRVCSLRQFLSVALGTSIVSRLASSPQSSVWLSETPVSWTVAFQTFSLHPWLGLLLVSCCFVLLESSSTSLPNLPLDFIFILIILNFQESSWSLAVFTVAGFFYT